MNMCARDIHGYISLGGSAAYRTTTDMLFATKKELTGSYDFKLGISYKKKYTIGIKWYNDRYLYQDVPILRHFVVYKNGVFIRAIQNLNNNFYVGTEFSLMRIDNNSGTSQTVLPIYSFSIGKLNTNKKFGLELKCDYLQFMKINNYNFLASIFVNV